MREDGTWGGHLELQAMALLEECNIVIHQLYEPRWEIRNFNTEGAKTIQVNNSSSVRTALLCIVMTQYILCSQVSYHDGDHYNSVTGGGGASIKMSSPQVNNQSSKVGSCTSKVLNVLG